MTRATRSGGQRFAWPYAAPGAKPTSGVLGAMPTFTGSGKFDLTDNAVAFKAATVSAARFYGKAVPMTALFHASALTSYLRR